MDSHILFGNTSRLKFMSSNQLLLGPLSQLLQQHEIGSDSNSITLAAQVAFTTDNSTARWKINYAN